ncbi:hypothetical protein Tco_1069923 [Tanacetum coccineum]|uniref:Tf2-1-like SH3-like domain-containing protein n=1 Tax=Tanacetum coccineum TaxID=301880 RepID=A0ABQ5HK09_9ASTR
MTIGLDLPKRILEAQIEALKPENLENEDVVGPRLRGSSTTGPELNRRDNENSQSPDSSRGCNPAQDRQKSYADQKQQADGVRGWERVYDQAKVGKVAYMLELPQELSRVHHTFHVSNLKKYYADEPLVMPLEGILVDDKLQFMEEPFEIMEQEIKRLNRSWIPLVKVRWNSRRGPEFTWERKDSFKQKYP